MSDLSLSNVFILPMEVVLRKAKKNATVRMVYLTDLESLKYGDTYIIKWPGDVMVIGEHIQTRGNDEEYPNFEVLSGPDNFGPYISTARANVIAVLEISESDRGVVIGELHQNGDKGEKEDGVASTLL